MSMVANIHVAFWITTS